MDGRGRQALQVQHLIVQGGSPAAHAEDERSGRTRIVGDPVEPVEGTVSDRSYTVVIVQVFRDLAACGDGRVIGEYAQLYTSHGGLRALTQFKIYHQE